MTNTKLDRKVLPKPDERRPELIRLYVNPRNEAEQKLLKIWEDVLNIGPVGIHDNFFDLGGHSLAASRVISRAIQTFRLDLPILGLFDAPTVAHMAAIIMQHQAQRPSGAEVAKMLTEVEAMTEEEARTVLKNVKGELS